MRDTKRLTLALAALTVLLLSLLIVWRSARPPAIARLLPESDAILYADLHPLRLATHFDRDPPERTPGYQRFVDATGIVPERDLDELAFSLLRRPDPTGPNGPVAWSEIASVRFDPARLDRYLAAVASTREQYAAHTVYTVSITDTGTATNRDLRVAILHPGLVAASNSLTPEQIHSIIDHERLGLFSSATPSLLTDHFRDVPVLANAWGVGRLGLPFTDATGLSLPLPAGETFIASLRYLGTLQLRVEALADSPAAAMQQTGALTSLAGLLRTVSHAQPQPPEIASALDSLTVTQAGSRTILRANLPLSLLRQLAASPAQPAASARTPTPPAPSNAPSASESSSGAANLQR